MENFKIWIISLCGAIAITSIIKLLFSESNLKKSVDIFCALFILFYTIIPITHLIDKDFKSISIEEYESNVHLEDGYNKIISKSIENICEKMSVEIISIEIDSYIDNDNFLNVDSVILDIAHNDMCEAVKERIKNEAGLEVEVI